MKLYPQMSRNQEFYLDYIRENPGCSKADVDRACRVKWEAGHRWVYDGVGRLIEQRVVTTEFYGGRHHLYVSG